MVTVLGDVRLHEYTGGRPAPLEELRETYTRLVSGPGRPGELWLNWVVRRRGDSQPVGTVQATVVERDGRSTAYVAWVTGVAWQGRGYASEAATALVGWLLEQGADEIVAHIHPSHRASATVARRAGLEPTEEESDGEQVWRRRGVI
jgi:RimJ/RimL family protein N-acetyltransferase